MFRSAWPSRRAMPRNCAASWLGLWRYARRAPKGHMDKRLLELLVCPICKGPLRSIGAGNAQELVCRPDRLAYAVRDGIPLMLPEEARALSADDPLLET